MGLPTLLTCEIAIALEQRRFGIVKGIQIWARQLIAKAGIAFGFLIAALYGLILFADLPIFTQFNWISIILLIPTIAEMKRTMGVLSGFKKVAQSRMQDGLIRSAILLGIGWIGLSFWEFSEQELLITYLGAVVLAVFFGVWLVRKLDHTWPAETAPTYDQAAWWRSLGPLTLFVAAGTIKTHSDVLMLGALTSAEAVAYYRVAMQIAGVAMLVQVTVNAFLDLELL